MNKKIFLIKNMMLDRATMRLCLFYIFIIYVFALAILSDIFSDTVYTGMCIVSSAIAYVITRAIYEN